MTTTDFQCPCGVQRATSGPDSKGATGANRACQWPLGDLRQIIEESLKGMVHSLRFGQRKSPEDGEFDVSFYFVDPAMARRIRIASTFTLTIFYGGKARYPRNRTRPDESGMELSGSIQICRGRRKPQSNCLTAQKGEGVSMPMPCDGAFLIRKTPMPTKMKCPPLCFAVEVDRVAGLGGEVVGMVGEVPVVAEVVAGCWAFNSYPQMDADGRRWTQIGADNLRNREEWT